MKAAVFAGPGQLELREIEKPSAGTDGLVLRVGANTVCGTDGRILRGEKTAGIDLGIVLGHEISGYVEEVGSEVEGFEVGDLVGVLPTVPCGQCYYCRRGMEHLCTDSEIFGYGINGGLAEYIRIPAEALQRGGVFNAPSHLSAVEVALAEPLGCVINGAHNYQPGIGDTVLIAGAGPIGLLHTQVCRLAGASNIIVSDPSESRREFAKKMGATHTVDPTQTDLAEFCKNLTDGEGADIGVICIGRPELVEDVLLCMRKGGHVNAFAGFSKVAKAQIDPNLIHYRELVITGASNAGRAAHEKALRLIGEGKIDVKSLHTHTFELADVHEAITVAANGTGIKVAVVPHKK